MGKKSGFTLAEIIITLTIIGVIAAISIPAMIQDIQDKQFRTAWRKIFADLSQAGKLLAQEYNSNLSGALTPTSGTDDDGMREHFLKYLSYTKLCDDGVADCWHASDKWFFLSDSIGNSNYSSKSKMILNNGSLIVFDLMNSECNDLSTPKHDACGDITVDVNGYKAPNKVSKDIFRAVVLKDGTLIPAGTHGDYYSNRTYHSCELALDSTTSGWACSAKYLYQ